MTVIPQTGSFSALSLDRGAGLVCAHRCASPLWQLLLEWVGKFMSVDGPWLVSESWSSLRSRCAAGQREMQHGPSHPWKVKSGGPGCSSYKELGSASVRSRTCEKVLRAGYTRLYRFKQQALDVQRYNREPLFQRQQQPLRGAGRPVHATPLSTGSGVYPASRMAQLSVATSDPLGSI